MKDNPFPTRVYVGIADHMDDTTPFVAFGQPTAGYVEYVRADAIDNMLATGWKQTDNQTNKER